MNISINIDTDKIAESMKNAAKSAREVSIDTLKKAEAKAKCTPVALKVQEKLGGFFSKEKKAERRDRFRGAILFVGQFRQRAPINHLPH